MKVCLFEVEIAFLGFLGPDIVLVGTLNGDVLILPSSMIEGLDREKQANLACPSPDQRFMLRLDMLSAPLTVKGDKLTS